MCPLQLKQPRQTPPTLCCFYAACCTIGGTKSCGKDCACIGNNNFCEKFCGCGPSCTNRCVANRALHIEHCCGSDLFQRREGRPKQQGVLRCGTNPGHCASTELPIAPHTHTFFSSQVPGMPVQGSVPLQALPLLSSRQGVRPRPLQVRTALHTPLCCLVCSALLAFAA